MVLIIKTMWYHNHIVNYQNLVLVLLLGFFHMRQISERFYTFKQSQITSFSIVMKYD